MSEGPNKTDKQINSDFSSAIAPAKNAASNLAKKEGKKLANKAANKLTHGALNKAKKGAKELGKKALKAIGKLIIKAITAIISALGWLIIPILIIIIVLLFSFLIENTNTASNNYSVSNSTVQDVLNYVLYSKYSVQSYYYVLEEPDDSAIEDEKNIYSGKSYKKLGGEESRGLTQGSMSNYIIDIDNYETKVALSPMRLYALDKELNKYEDGGFFYPEQFTKMLYVKDCDVNADDLDIKACSLGDLKEAQSSKFVDNGDGTYSASTELENSVYDYGFGSLVHYQAYLQPSRIADYKLETVSYIDDNWSYDTSSDSPLKQDIPWDSLSQNEQEKILAKYKSADNNNYINQKNSQGLVSGLGIYDVDKFIYYKNWAELYYSNENEKTINSNQYNTKHWDKWASSDPGVSTGLLDTSVVYAIDYALTYYGEVPYDTIQEWTDLGEANHIQQSLYIKDYTSNQSQNHKEYTIKNFGNNNIEPLKRLYVNGEQVGYIVDDPVWHDGFFFVDISETRTESNEVKNDKTYCEKKYPVKHINGTIDKEDDNYSKYNDCLNNKHTEEETKNYYEVVYVPGYWEYTIKYDNKGNEVNTVETLMPNTGASYAGYDVSEYNTVKQIKPTAGKENDEVSWYYQPSYMFTLKSTTAGIFQVYLVSHVPNIKKNITEENLEYIKNYVGLYKPYFPYNEGIKFSCYTENIQTDEYGTVLATLNEPGSNALSGGVLTPNECKTNHPDTKTYPMSSNYNTLYSETPQSFNVNETTRDYALFLAGKLGITWEGSEEDKKNSVLVTPDSISGALSYDKEKLVELEEIRSTYSKSLKAYSGKYGVDENLLVSMLYTAKQMGTNRTGVTTDVYHSSILEVDVFNSSTVITENVDLNKKSIDEIGKMAAKMQTLLKEYDGNVLLALLEYNLGHNATEKVLQVYQEQTGNGKKAVIKSMYESGWNHFVEEVINNASYYETPLNTYANVKYVKSVIENSPTSSFVWIKRDGKKITTQIWNCNNVYDSQKNYSVYSEDNPYRVSAWYKLTKDGEDKLKQNWNYITFGQVSFESGLYVKGHKYNSKGYLDANTKFKTIRDYERGDSNINYIVRKIIMKGSTYCQLLDDSVPIFYCLDERGAEDNNVMPYYEKYLGDWIAPPASKYENLENGDEELDKFTDWRIKTDKGEDIFSITTGTVTVATDNYVRVDLNDNVFVEYDGLTNVSVNVDDTIQNDKIGESSGIVLIRVSIDGMHYNMYYFVQQYLSHVVLGSRMFSSLTAGNLGSYKGKTLSWEASMTMWKEINNTKIRGACSNNCTIFVNWEVEKNWGTAIKEVYGDFLSCAGDGRQKVDALSDVYGKITEKLYNLPSNGSNIAFSWGNGSYGHTGWIDECYYDPSVEGNGYVIVSQGNIAGGYIQYKWKYTWDEWQKANPSGSISYITLKDNYKTK